MDRELRRERQSRQLTSPESEGCEYGVSLGDRVVVEEELLDQRSARRSALESRCKREARRAHGATLVGTAATSALRMPSLRCSKFSTS